MCLRFPFLYGGTKLESRLEMRPERRASALAEVKSADSSSALASRNRILTVGLRGKHVRKQRFAGRATGSFFESCSCTARTRTSGSNTQAPREHAPR